MDEGTLKHRLWDGFARLQALLGGHARAGSVLEADGLMASVVPSAPESPALNAVVALEPRAVIGRLGDLRRYYARAGVRRWGVWLDGSAVDVAATLRRNGLMVASASPGMGAAIAEIAGDGDVAYAADLKTVGRINDLAYGNPDHRLERTLSTLPPDALRAYVVEYGGRAAAAALALFHGGDCGVSFVATVPEARRRGLATRVMHGLLQDAFAHGCETITLQATPEGERLYDALGLHRLGMMELWEHR